MLTNCFAACTHLYSTVSQLFELQVQKNRRFVSPGDARTKKIQCFPNPSQHVRSGALALDARIYKYIANKTDVQIFTVFNSFRVMRCLIQCVSPKIAIFYLIFVSYLFQTSRSTYLSIFNSLRVIRSLNQCVTPKIAIGAITLNVVWMESEFDAYKLPSCMCPYDYNGF